MRRRARRRNDGAGDEEQWLPFGIEDHEVAAFNILWDLRAVVFVGRLPDPTTVFAGPALLANVRNQSEHEALAARCLATWPSLIREGGGEGKRYDRSLVEAGGCGSHCCSPAQVGSVERRTVRAGESGWHMDGTRHVSLGRNSL
jgi:hypothetical protein